MIKTCVFRSRIKYNYGVKMRETCMVFKTLEDFQNAIYLGFSHIIFICVKISENYQPVGLIFMKSNQPVTATSMFATPEFV